VKFATDMEMHAWVEPKSDNAVTGMG
jgi:hypothetical protein